jgi:hypothetical protein
MAMHCIVLPVKFDGRLSIPVLRNEQFFTKNWGLKTDQFPKSSNFGSFKSRHFEKGQTLGKSLTFLDSDRLGYRTTLSSRSLRYTRAVFFLNSKESAVPENDMSLQTGA